MRCAFIFLSFPLAIFDANAAEAYNKDGEKLDLYGEIEELRYFSDSKPEDSDMSYLRMEFRGKTQINNKILPDKPFGY